MLLRNICLISLIFFAAFTSCGTSKNVTLQEDEFSSNEVLLSMPDTSAKTAATKKSLTKTRLSKDDLRIQNKYASKLGVNPDSIVNIRLFRFIEEWEGTPYLWGGSNKNGIDCSAFVQKLLAQVYNIYIPRTSLEQVDTYNVETFTRRTKLSLGDLVFFKTLNNGNVVTHVGMYLANNKFVNSSSTYGVSIGSLTDRYWSSKFVTAGRLIAMKSKKVYDISKN